MRTLEGTFSSHSPLNPSLPPQAATLSSFPQQQRWAELPGLLGPCDCGNSGTAPDGSTGMEDMGSQNHSGCGFHQSELEEFSPEQHSLAARLLRNTVPSLDRTTNLGNLSRPDARSKTNLEGKHESLYASPFQKRQMKSRTKCL